MSGMENVAIRRTERHDVALRGRFRIAELHAGVVRLAKASGMRDGAIEADVVDISGGGLGLLTPVFIPRRVHLRCQVLVPGSEHTVLECTGIVSRVVMTDRRPMYLIGVTFDEMSDATRERLAALLVELGEVG